MIKSKLKFLFLFSLVLFSTGCSLFEGTKPGSNINKNSSDNIVLKETIQVTIACDQKSIQTYIDKGWTVIGQTEEEVPCSWKTVKASKKCNIKRDKGCAITVPDIIGKKLIYTLTKEKFADSQ